MSEQDTQQEIILGINKTGELLLARLIPAVASDRLNEFTHNFHPPERIVWNDEGTDQETIEGFMHPSSDFGKTPADVLRGAMIYYQKEIAPKTQSVVFQDRTQRKEISTK